MLDILEYALRPLTATLLAVARFLLWFGWDLMFQIVGWSVGWLVLRGLTLGRFPRERLSQMDEAPYAVWIELVGLACLAGLIIVLV